MALNHDFCEIKVRSGKPIDNYTGLKIKISSTMRSSSDNHTRLKIEISSAMRKDLAGFQSKLLCSLVLGRSGVCRNWTETSRNE